MRGFCRQPEGFIRPRALLIAVSALALVSAPAEAHIPYEPSLSTCDGKSVVFHQHRARSLLKAAYVEGPDHGLIDKAQVHKRCIRIEKVRLDLAEYRAKQKLELREREQMVALTPYDCGSPGRFAIPCYVVACESHYNWGAVNPSSGARSVYQLLPSTYAGVCESCDWARLDQHLAAGRVWARSGGSEWSCA